MSTKAHVMDEWQRDMVGIAVMREHGSRRELLQWGGVVIESRDATEAYRMEDDEADRLHIRVEDARAIYEALADFFGHSGHDTRALRKDYDAERGRVDKLLAHLTRPTA